MPVYLCKQHTSKWHSCLHSLCAQGSNFALSFIIHNLLQQFCKFSTSPLMQQWDWDADSFPCVVCVVLFFSLITENAGYGFSLYLIFPFQFGDDLNYAELCRQATSKDFLLWSMHSPPVKPAKITLESSTWTHHLEFRGDSPDSHKNDLGIEWLQRKYCVLFLSTLSVQTITNPFA